MASRFLIVATLCLGLVGPFVACGSESEGDGGSGPSSSSAGGGSSSSSSSASASSSSAASTGSGQTLSCPSGPPYETLGGNGPEVDPACNLLTQEGCPNPGEACEPKSVGGVYKAQCVVSDGLKGVKEPCVTSNECQGGLYCVFGLCSPVCCQATNEPCEGGSCNFLYSGDSAQYGPGKAIRLCSFLVQCEMLTADACEGGTECHVQDSSLALCVPPSGNDIPEGGVCQYLNDCGDMQDCWNNAVCRYHCWVSDGGAGEPGLGGCPAGQTCVEADYGIPDLGICQLR